MPQRGQAPDYKPPVSGKGNYSDPAYSDKRVKEQLAKGWKLDKNTLNTYELSHPSGSTMTIFKDPSMMAAPNSFKHGGMVQRTGMAKVHKGERVLTRKQNSLYSLSKRLQSK